MIASKMPFSSLHDELTQEELSEVTGDQLASEFVGEHILLRETDLSDSELARLSLEYAVLEKLQLRNCQWPGLHLYKTWLGSCEAGMAQWLKSRLEQAEFDRCFLTGFTAADSVWHEVCFRGCKLELAILQGVRMQRCRFEKCDLREADLQGSQLTDVEFRDCDLRGARLAGVKQTRMDLRGSQLAGLAVSPEALRGATVDPLQLTDLASAFGLSVEMPDTVD